MHACIDACMHAFVVYVQFESRMTPFEVTTHSWMCPFARLPGLIVQLKKDAEGEQGWGCCVCCCTLLLLLMALCLLLRFAVSHVVEHAFLLLLRCCGVR